MQKKFDEIRIEDLEVFANHGVFPEENTLGQKFVVSAVLFTDTRMAGKTDDLTASIHYGEVSAFITEFLQKNTYQLLERAAEELAEALLLEWDRIEKISIEIKKPWAPVRLPLKTVSVKIERGWHTVYIALGSNIGDSKMYLDNAVKALNELPTSKVEVVSEYLVTPPYGVTDQPDFLNGCLKLRTLLYPYELLAELNRIEKEAGRERIIHWGPRTLDLDIIFYDGDGGACGLRCRRDGADGHCARSARDAGAHDAGSAPYPQEWKIKSSHVPEEQFTVNSL